MTEVKTSFQFSNQYSEGFVILTHYYWSTDTTLDANDQLLDFSNFTTSGSIANLNKIITIPEGTLPGQYYVLHQHDVLNVLAENNEDDNIGYTSVIVRPIFNLPYTTDFETADDNWRIVLGANPSTPTLWSRGLGTRHHIEKSHSGVNAWHTSNTLSEHPDTTFQCVETPYFNLGSSSDPLLLSFWYKCHYPWYVGAGGNTYHIQYSVDCSNTWNFLYELPENLSDEWELIKIPLDESINSNANIRFRITYQGSYLKPEGIIFDDFYVGPDKADLTIEGIYSNNRFLTVSSATDVLHYNVNPEVVTNSNFVTRFYWSNDAVLDASDVLLGEQTLYALTYSQFDEALQTMVHKLEKKQAFSFIKPTQTIGTYYIIYQLDATNQISESIETNNSGVIPVQVMPALSVPYFNDFETNAMFWDHDATLGVDEWELASPQGQVFNEAFSGENAWITKATGQITPMSRMHLYTPVFDLTTTVDPVLAFDMLLDNINGGFLLISENMSYSVDNGATWHLLQPQNAILTMDYTKWYTIMHYNNDNGLDVYSQESTTGKLFAKSEPNFTNQIQYDTRDSDRNTRYMVNISHLKEESSIRFRFNLASDHFNMNQVNTYGDLEGALIDNFEIKEAAVDLHITSNKILYWSSQADLLKFSMSVKNSGTAYSNATDVTFYLSTDTTLDASDFNLGTTALPRVRPDYRNYQNLEFSVPTDFSTYQYLIYVIDSQNLTSDSNLGNNIGFWELGLSGITTYPYFEDFEEDVIHGWHGYAYTNMFGEELSNYRVKHRIPVSHSPSIHDRLFDGILATEQVPLGAWQAQMTPLYHIYTPAFNFTAYTDPEPLVMSFDIMCVGSPGNTGGTMEYSLNGGSTWLLLDDLSGPSVNFYNEWEHLTAFNQPGWSWQDGLIKTVKMDVSFLQNQPNVVFRYNYYSNSNSYFGRGLRLDNFSIGQEALTNALNCTETIPYVSDLTAFEENCWEIGSNGEELILLARNEDPELFWQQTTNFAADLSNPSAKIDMVGQGNTTGAWLISPKFNLVENSSLKFDIALTPLNEFGSATLDSDDSITLKYTINNGYTWSDLYVWNNGTPISNQPQTVTITELPESFQIRFAFVAGNGTQSGNETTFYVDNFELYAPLLTVGSTQQLSLKYHPNPVEDLFYITSEQDTIDIVRVYSVFGQLLQEFHPNSRQINLNFSELAAGMYFVTIVSGEKSSSSKVLKK